MFTLVVKCLRISSNTVKCIRLIYNFNFAIDNFIVWVQFPSADESWRLLVLYIDVVILCGFQEFSRNKLDMV